MTCPEEVVLESPDSRADSVRGMTRTGKGRPHELRRFLQLTQEDYARLLDVRVRTVVRWEVGATEPNPATKEKLEYLLRLSKSLGKLIGKKRIAQWLATPNPEFLNQPPLDLVQSKYGRCVLEQEVERSEWGIPG
jgi:DNA-binding XRE family transcriptional regulator